MFKLIWNKLDLVLTILVFIIVQRTQAGKRQKALFSLKEVDINSINTQSIKIPNDNETSYLLKKTKENLIRAFGLRQNMVEIGDKIKRRQPHKYMIHIANEYEDLYKIGTPLSANTVRGCVDIGRGDKRLADFPHISFKFDISEIPSSETITQTELKILMKCDTFGLKTLKSGSFSLKIYGVFPRNKVENRKKHKHAYPMLFDIASKQIVTVKGQKERWISFDVTPFVNIVKNSKRKHVKFVIRAKPFGGVNIDPKIIGISNHLKFETEKGLLVIFSGEGGPTKVHNKRQKRDVSKSYKSKSQRRKDRKKEKRRRRKNRKNKGRKAKCQKKPMVVRFSDFGWSNFLIQPTEQDLFYCQGNCNYPVPSHIKTSNHATIQSIVHAMNPTFVPAPCCVPDEYEVLPVLSLDGNDRVVFKLKEGLIVKSCACR